MNDHKPESERAEFQNTKNHTVMIGNNDREFLTVPRDMMVEVSEMA